MYSIIYQSSLKDHTFIHLLHWSNRAISRKNKTQQLFMNNHVVIAWRHEAANTAALPFLFVSMRQQS